MGNALNVRGLLQALGAVTALMALVAPPVSRAQEEDDGNERQSEVRKPVAAVTLSELLSGKVSIDFQSASALYRQAILSDENISKLLALLESHGANEQQPADTRVHALLLGSHLQWHDGKIKGALQFIDQALLIKQNPDALLHKARLLEAAGDVSRARQCYEQVLPLLQDARRKEDVRLRLTFIEVGKKNIGALVDLARERDRPFRNRAAVALAILNYYKEASQLYEVSGQGSELFRQHLRLAQWALRAGDARQAQEEAWTAVQLAPLDRDRLYSLSVALDAYEMNGSLDELLRRFEAKRQLTAEEQNTRIEILRKQKRYPEAIRLFKTGSAEQVSPQAQQALLRMYRDAGRNAEMVAEYKTLMTKEPDSPAWPSGLSRYLLEQNDQAGARQVWHDFIGRNGESAVLLTGATDMIRFGFDDLALEASEKVLGGYELDHFSALLFNFNLHLRRGRVADAEKALDRALSALPPDSAHRVEIADGYERLKKPHKSLEVFERLAKNRRGGLGVDEKMRMAWLYDGLGQRDQALQLWQSMWNENVSDARRKLIEDRLLLLAAETGEVGSLAVDLEGQLIRGTGSHKDAALLVRIYTEARDIPAAVEIIRKYFNQGGRSADAVASLQEQAKVYQATDRFGAYAQINERLLALDPEGKVNYLQALVINCIENGTGAPEAKLAELNRWLAMLRADDAAAAGDEFEAGILELAGLDDRAIAVYRRALAADPTHSDNYLLLADLLKRAKRESEAIATLQYQVEATGRDDAFIVAVDGILNMQPQDRTVIKWAQRRVLERLTARDDKLYLYDLLADLADFERDGEVFISALENSLAHANSRRSTVLRQLISVTNGGVSNLGARAAGRFTRPDLELNLMYARRLVALGEELPPEIYLDMGRTLLKMQDVESASDAFNLAIDRTGRVALTEETGDYFRRAGYDKQAIAQYERALIGEAGRMSLMCKLAEARDRSGQRETANQLYLSALLDLIGKQPIVVSHNISDPGDEEVFTQDYKDYYWRLLTGFLRTLPPEAGNVPAQPPAHFAQIEALLGDTVRQTLQERGAAEGGAQQFARYARLGVAAQFARTAAIRAGYYDQADKLDLGLLKTFGSDSALLDAMLGYRTAYGLRSSVQALKANKDDAARGTGAELKSDVQTDMEIQVPSVGMVERALRQTDFERAATVAAFIGEQDLALSVYRDWLKDAVDKKKSAKPNSWNSGPGFGWILSSAQERLDTQHYTRLSSYIFEMLKLRPEYAIMLLHSGATGGGFGSERINVRSASDSRLLEMEALTGSVLFNERWLMESCDAINEDKYKQADMVYVMSKLSQTNQVAFLERYLAARGFFQVSWDEVFSALQMILRKPLAADQGKQLSAGLEKIIGAELAKGKHAITDRGRGAEGVVRAVTTWYGVRFDGMDKANLPWLESLDEVLCKTHPEAFMCGVFTINAGLDAGRTQQAISSVVDNALVRYGLASADDKSDIYRGGTPYERGYNGVKDYVRHYASRLFPGYAQDITALLAEKERAVGLSPAMFAVQMALREADPVSNDATLARWLEEKSLAAPDNETVLAALWPLYRKLGFVDKQMQVLEKLVAIAPQNIGYRAALFSCWEAFDNPEKALESAGGRLADVRLSQGKYWHAARTGPDIPPDAERLWRRIVRVDAGGSAEDARLAFRALLQLVPPARISDARRQAEPETGDDSLKIVKLADLQWSYAAVDEDADAGAMPSEGLAGLKRLLKNDDADAGTEKRSGKFLEMVIKQPFSIPELEAFVLAQEARDIDGQYLIYKLLADAYELHGQTAAVLRRSEQAIEAGAIGNKALTVWLDLVSRQPAEVAAAALALLEKQGMGFDGAGLYQRVLLARLSARAGRDARAVDLYSAVLVLSQTRTESNWGLNDRTAFFNSLSGLYDDATKYLAEAGLERFARNILTIGDMKRLRSSSHFTVIAELAKRYPDSKVFAAAFQDICAQHTSLNAWTHSKRIMAADVLARSGKNAEALRMVNIALKGYTDDPGAGGDQDYEGHALIDRSYTGRVNVSRFAAFRIVLASPADTWPGAREWMSQVVSSIPAWTKQQIVSNEGAVWLLCSAALRQQQLGFADNAQTTARLLLEHLNQPQALSLSTGTLAVSVLREVGVAADASMLDGLIRYRRLKPVELALAIDSVAQTTGTSTALSLGESAIGYTRNEDLLRKMKDWYAAAGDTGKVRALNEMNLRAGEARGNLERGEDVQASDVVMVAERVDAVQNPIAPAAQPEVGDTLDIKFTALDGREVDLSKLRGKVVLVDFWATWCGPCRSEMPNLKRVYDAYRDKGFEVLGVTLDSTQSKQALIDYCKTNGLAWPQHFDGKGWKNELAAKYAVDEIPSAFLLDQKGKLVTKTARGNNLEAEVKRLLGIGD